MNAEGFLAQAFIYLLAAVVSVPIAKRLGLGSVLGYLLAGVAIGPFVLGLIGEEGQDVMHFAEFGVVMMLFLVGLELEPARLWRLRGPILGLGGSQVALTAVAIGGIALFAGQDWRPSLAIGLILALSSTAIVLQTLEEKGLLRTGGGESAFSVLLFQDIAVIPMLAALPLLASPEVLSAAHADPHHGGSWVDGLPAWAHTAVVFAAVAGIVAGGRTLIGPAFRFIARSRLREIFTAAALLLVIGIALLMQTLGLSPALGTFLAGVVLANSEFRHELEGDIEPFKGLLLGLFFIAVGASIDFGLIADHPVGIVGAVFALIALKLAVLLLLGRLFGLTLDQRTLFAFALAQGGEFAFVLFAFAKRTDVLGSELADPLVAVVALSMAVTPLLMLANERLLQPRIGTREREPRAPDAVHESHPVLIAGFGRFGQIVGRLLAANGIRATVLDDDSDAVDVMRRLGYEVYYGDATRLELLRAAGAERARLLVLAIDSPEQRLELLETVRKHFPRLQVVVRARDRGDAYALHAAGAQHVYRETLDSALALGSDVLQLLGLRAHRARRAARALRRHDERAVRELSALRDDPNYFQLARVRLGDIEEILREEIEHPTGSLDRAWDTRSLRREFGGD